MDNNDVASELFRHCPRCRRARRHLRYSRHPGWFCDHCKQYSPDARPAGVTITLCCLATVIILSIMVYMLR